MQHTLPWKFIKLPVQTVLLTHHLTPLMVSVRSLQERERKRKKGESVGLYSDKEQPNVKIRRKVRITKRKININFVKVP